MSVESDSLRKAIIAGVNEVFDKKDQQAKRWAEEDARRRPIEAARLAKTQENAPPILAGLAILKNLPGSKFTFYPDANGSKLFIKTNVQHSGFRDLSARATISIEDTEVRARGFSTLDIYGTTLKPEAFLKKLASALAAEKIIPRQPEDKNSNTVAPQKPKRRSLFSWFGCDV